MNTSCEVTVVKLEKHITDTLKEWQLKLGGIEDRVCLYYPVDSICEYLEINGGTDRDVLLHSVKQYLNHHAAYLGDVRLNYSDNRMCIEIPEEGCAYVEKNIKTPEFLREFLSVLKEQDMEKLKGLFQEYAARCHGNVMEDTESDGMGTVLYFEQDEIDPYVYCIDQDVFGITYHRFSKHDYEKMQ